MKKRKFKKKTIKEKTSRKLFIGIDPGNKGAIAWIGPVEDSVMMPILKKSKPIMIDDDKLIEILTVLKNAWIDVYAVVEKAQSMPKQSSQSGFNYGVSYGKLLLALRFLKIPYMEVRPKVWKDVILKGTKKDKEAAIMHCRNKYPNIDLIPEPKKTPQDGIADAVCIAEYCKREFK